MSSEPVLSGEITEEGAIPVLQEVEKQRTTGVLRFRSPEVEGQVELISGQIAFDQPEMPDGRDPVEVLLALRKGTYEVKQCLPTLPVSTGDERVRRGSLAVHVPADLMNYCERAGLTGTLALEKEGRRAEALYDQGALIAIRVEGSDPDDLHDVFGWEEGTFEITAHAAPPPVESEGEEAPALEAAEPEPGGGKFRKDESTGQLFLRSVEVALASIVEEREKRRNPSRSSPPMPEPRKTRPSDSAPKAEPAEGEAPRRRRREPTVRVIYLGARESRSGESGGTRHVRKDITGETALPDASPERRSAAGEAPREPSSEERPSDEEGSTAVNTETDTHAAPAAEPRTTILGTLVWVLLVAVLMLGSLAILARLPALQ